MAVSRYRHLGVFLYRARVYTAYEYLEKRLDSRTRTLASFLFLVSRSLSCGVIIAAPAVILSIVLGWNLTLTILGIGLPTVLYTMVGGVQAVTWTDVKQMGVIVAGVVAAVVILLLQLPDHVSLGDALRVAGTTGRMQALDFAWDPNKTYTFWSGLIGGLFLMLSYFGCDQSQVQRYLTAKSISDGRQSLLMSAYFKIPLQFLIPLIGVLIFVFYVFHQPPLLFRTLLADQAGYPTSICKHGFESQTVFSIIIQLDTLKAWIGRGHACETEYTEYQLEPYQ